MVKLTEEIWILNIILANKNFMYLANKNFMLFETQMSHLYYNVCILKFQRIFYTIKVI